MNVHQRALVKSTFDRLRPIPKSAGVVFYERLFELDPALRRLFRGSVENQAAMFVTALNMVVAEFVEQGFVPQSVRDLGSRHEGYGVEDPSYETFGEALLWTLGRLLGAHFTPEVRDAWSAAYEALAAAMKQAAAETRETRAAAESGGPRPGGLPPG